MNKPMMMAVVVLLCSVLAQADYLSDRKAALAQVQAGKDSDALALFVKMAEGPYTDFQKSDALGQAAWCACRLKRNDQAMEPWLDEALATYSERLFYEQNYPDVNAWQAFRIDAYNPSGWVDTDIYHGGDFRTYANAVYLRGAEFLQALRGRLSDEVYFAFLKDYAAQMAGKLAISSDFFRILRQHTNKDISDLLSNYFQNPH